MLTKEQQNAVDVVMSQQNGILAINAVAGSGKTHTAHNIIKAVQPKTGFYSAFNKAIVTDSKQKFGNLIDCKTFHALAYKYVQPSKSIEDLHYNTIKEDLPYEDKAVIIETLDNFFRSSSVDIQNYVETHCHNLELQGFIVHYANKMLDGEIPPTFNYLLKCLHLMLLHNEVQIDFDLLLYDEVQDVTSVTLEIFKLINAKRKVMLGDTYQNIYSFMDTVNAFEELKDVNLFKLTKSFRCNEDIADEVEKFGMKYLEDDFVFSGNEFIIPESQYKVAYISRTNAMLIERMYKLINQRQSFKLTRDIKDIFSLPTALLMASQGKPVFEKKYKYLEREYHKWQDVKKTYKTYFEYIVDITEDSLLESVSKMLLNFSQKGINIFKLRESVTNLIPNSNIILTTAHAFKGLEMDNVYIEDDLNNSVNRTILRMKELSRMVPDDPRNYLTKEQKEDLNTYYVALSRAKTGIVNVNYF